MPLRLIKKPRESWRECVQRIAGEYHLEKECLAQFDEAIDQGTTPEETIAWDALCEWDCLEYVKEETE